jgi:hypothetical protein
MNATKNQEAEESDRLKGLQGQPKLKEMSRKLRSHWRGRGNCECKGPGVELCCACFRNTWKASVAQLE